MSERVRSISVTVEVDTNKQTYRFDDYVWDGESAEDVARAVREFIEDCTD